MRRVILFAASLLFLFSIPTGTTEALQVFTTSEVVAPTCCGSGRVVVYNTATFTNAEPYWYNVSFSHLWLSTYIDCEQTYNHFAETCCIHAGNDVQRSDSFEGAQCPINAKGRSYAWAGGGALPYREDASESLCLQPCYCGEFPGDGGQDCEIWDPFCEPWGEI